MKIPITKPYVGKEEEEAVAKVLRSGWLTSGPCVEELEGVVANYTGAEYTVATGNCTQALHLALLACGIGKGDKVIVPSFTFPATANAVMHAGAKPVFCDVDRETYNATVPWIDEKPAISVSLFGLRAMTVGTVEDAACGLGSVPHSGQSPNKATCYSFHPRKIITTGEGGMLVTNDYDVARKARYLRDHGCERPPSVRIVTAEGETGTATFYPVWHSGGYNMRMTDIQAAIGIEQMKKLLYILECREDIAARYDAELPEALKRPPKGGNYQSYVCTYDGDRDAVIAKLRERGIETTKGTYACHRIWGLPDKDYPNSSYLADHTLSIPIFPAFTEEEQGYVIEALKEVV